MLTASIKNLARQSGFDQIGITRPSGLEEGEKALQEWIQEGRHGGMKYLEDFKARKKKFYEDFPAPKSVIVLGVNYYQPLPPGEVAAFSGKIARYAWGKDYHEVIHAKHETLILQIRELAGPDFMAKSCVDIQPVPEKFAGQVAGLGFQGKNTLLLSRQFGPWLFLSEIITNLDLEEDKADTGNCGTCNSCQTVCPTGALDKDYTIDARRCIAYLTIEHKGMIPRELRPHIKDWVFGCDECLTICPFSSKSKPGAWPEFHPSAGFGPAMQLPELFEISSNREFEEMVRGTALSRVNRKQMLRNACLVLGNSGLPEAVPLLKAGLQDSAPLVRLHAAWALGRFPGTRPLLEERLSSEQDPEVRDEIRHALTATV